MDDGSSLFLYLYRSHNSVYFLLFISLSIFFFLSLCRLFHLYLSYELSTFFKSLPFFLFEISFINLFSFASIFLFLSFLNFFHQSNSICLHLSLSFFLSFFLLHLFLPIFMSLLCVRIGWRISDKSEAKYGFELSVLLMSLFLQQL